MPMMEELIVTVLLPRPTGKILKCKSVLDMEGILCRSKSLLRFKSSINDQFNSSNKINTLYYQYPISYICIHLHSCHCCKVLWSWCSAPKIPAMTRNNDGKAEEARSWWERLKWRTTFKPQCLWSLQQRWHWTWSARGAGQTPWWLSLKWLKCLDDYDHRGIVEANTHTRRAWGEENHCKSHRSSHLGDNIIVIVLIIIVIVFNIFFFWSNKDNKDDDEDGTEPG